MMLRAQLVASRSKMSIGGRTTALGHSSAFSFISKKNTAHRIHHRAEKIAQQNAKPRVSLVVRAGWNNDVSFGPAKVVDQKQIAQNMHRLLVDAGAEVTKGYTIPGQFVQIKVEESKPGFFAIASAPDANNAGVIELLVKNAGETAEKLCSSTAGSDVEISSVMGKGFPVDKIPPSSFDRVFIFATGSGIAPIKAIIEAGVLKPSERTLVKLYYGARNKESMAFYESLGDWTKQYGVEIQPVFSEDGAYVQDVFAKEGHALGKGVAAILCGQKEMAMAITDIFTEGGVEKEYLLTNF
jgi:NAD(P)H-flavin reductase